MSFQVMALRQAMYNARARMIDEDNAEARLRGKRSKNKGDQGEMIARRALIDMGYLFIRRIATPWIIRRDRNGKVIGAKAGDKVAGDWRAVHPETGWSVLAEVKLRDNPTLQYSTLEDHQHRSLAEHSEAGGISLLIWVHDSTPYVLPYPIEGFKPRSSITIEQAKELNWL